MASQPTIASDLSNGFDLIDPRAYVAAGAPHESYAALRRSSPLHYCEPAGYAPFWAVTKHANICSISKRPDAFLNAPGIVHPRADIPVDRSEGVGAMRTIIEMDPPEHRSFRKVASPWFTARARKHRSGGRAERARSRRRAGRARP
jgi:cytochrome P450